LHSITIMSTCSKARSRNDALAIVERWSPNGGFPTLVIDDKRAILGFREQEIREAFGA